MNVFEAAISHYYTPSQWQRIQQTRIGIAGAGGLGSNIGRPKVQVLAERLKLINPAVEIATFQTRLTAENITHHFESADCLCEAFDRPEAKQMFLEAFLASKKFLVMGSGMAGISNQTPIAIRKLKENLHLVGDSVTPVGPENPPCAPRVSACAGLMASVILEHVCREAN